jgi:membrane protease YdiL (CAAX protease family)
MSTTEDSRIKLKKQTLRLELFSLFVIIGLLTFFVFSHFRPVLPRITDIPARIAFIVVLLASSLLLRRSERFSKYWLVLFAFFTAALAQALDYYFSGWSLNLLGLDVSTPAGAVLDKLESTFLIAVPIILLTRLSGNSMGSIYLQKGNLKQGLIIGLTVFVVVAVESIPWAKFQYQTGDLSLHRIVPWVPWILLFVLANGFNEELLFRGLFLGKLEPLLGAFPANLCMAIPFVALHYGVDYTQNIFLLMALLLPLGLGLGYVMQRTNSIIASWLIHASFDIAVVLALFSQL